MTIWFDMDGTIADLYGVDGWLDMLRAFKPLPYFKAAPMVNMSIFARYLHKAQRAGISIGIISWLSRSSTPEYDEAVEETKLGWLKEHLPSVDWDEINIVDYGTDKSIFMHSDEDILFDDEPKNRENWGGLAFTPDEIMEVLKGLTKGR